MLQSTGRQFQSTMPTLLCAVSSSALGRIRSKLAIARLACLQEQPQLWRRFWAPWFSGSRPSCGETASKVRQRDPARCPASFDCKLTEREPKVPSLARWLDGSIYGKSNLYLL